MKAVWAVVEFVLRDIIQFQAFFSIFVLGAFIVATNLLQRRALDRSAEVMRQTTRAVQTTHMFADASQYFARRSPPTQWDILHLLPFLFLLGITLFFSILSYYAAQFHDVLKEPSFVLGGTTVYGRHSDVEVYNYQASSMFMISVAFLVAYIRVIAKLVERINTSDMRPISYYFLSVNMLTSVLVAIVTRHVAGALTPGEAMPTPDWVLALMAFVIGWNPKLWLDTIWKKATDYFKIVDLKPRIPDKENLPQDMNLMMIQGLDSEKIERLEELGVHNCQDLAERNPVVLWLRTPFTLELLVDWMGQALLCLYFEDERIELLRQVGVRDVFGYMEGLADDASMAAVVAVLNTAPAAPPADAGARAPRPAITADMLKMHKRAIPLDPAFVQLRELRTALAMPIVAEDIAPAARSGGDAPADDG
ncbi:MAG TPA: hypothetical protein VG889_12715 [Rhizomicrobium sp.]|nr:hypothetical protein [Rhizomicrobium sp.]